MNELEVTGLILIVGIVFWLLSKVAPEHKNGKDEKP